MKLLTGLFVDQERKASFVKNVVGPKYMLEASFSRVFERKRFWRKKQSDTDYFPQYCFLVDLRAIALLIFRPSFWALKLELKDFKEIYRIEKQTFKYRVDPYQKNRVVKKLFAAFSLIFFSIYALTKPFKCMQEIKFYKKQNGNSEVGQIEARIQKAWFKFRFILGYKYCLWLFSKVFSNKKIDQIYHWGPNWTSAKILSTFALKHSLPFYNVEYGEIENTFSVNKIGMFGDSDFYRNITAVLGEPLTVSEKKHAEEIVEYCRLKNSSQIDIELFRNKKWEKPMFSVETRHQFDGVVYVSGVELLYSGWSVSPEGRFLGNPNQAILNTVSEALENRNYLILYREHPIAVKQTPSLSCRTSDLCNVVDCSLVPFSYVLQIADYVVSAPSKVQFESLLMGKKVLSFGQCIAPPNIKISNFQQIKGAFESSVQEVKVAFDLLEEKSNKDTVSVVDYAGYLRRSLISS